MKCDHAVQLCTCCICGCTVHKTDLEFFVNGVDCIIPRVQEMLVMGSLLSNEADTMPAMRHRFVPPLLSDTGVSTSLFSDTASLFSDVASCDEDGEEADEGAVEEELVEILGTTDGTYFDFLQSILLPFLMRC